MTTTNIFYIIGTLAIIIYCVYKKLEEKQEERAKEFVRRVFRVWAEFGPFKNGEESSRVMYHTQRVVIHTENDVSGHYQAYDRDPHTWEETRLSYLKDSKFDGFDDDVSMVKGMLAGDDLNETMYREAGIQQEFVMENDGKFSIIIKNIDGSINPMSAEEAYDHTLNHSVGVKLLDDESFEADLLVTALKTIFEKQHNRAAKEIYELGETYWMMIGYSKDNPGDDLSKTFTDLNEIWLEARNESNS
jgi:hypothetical protein